MYDNASLEKPEVLIQQLEAGKAYIATVTALNKKVTPSYYIHMYTIQVTLLYHIHKKIHIIYIVTVTALNKKVTPSYSSLDPLHSDPCLP